MTGTAGNPMPAGTAVADRVAAATDAIWRRARRIQLARAATIETAVMALLEGRLDEDDRRDAEREAHKIAGAAGTFGVPRASELARELESLLASRPNGSAAGLRAAALVAELHEELSGADDRSPGQPPVPAVPADEPDAVRDAGTRVLVMHADAVLATAVARGLVVRGLVPLVATDVDQAAEVLHGQDPPAAAVLQLAVTGGEPDEQVLALVRDLDQRGATVLGLLPPAAGTTGRVVAQRAGARVLLDVAATDAGAAMAADAVAALVATRPHQASRVLAVDDDETVLMAIRAVFAQDDAGAAGVVTDVAALGDPARFWETLGRVEPDLVILDVDMPGLDGLELCGLLRGDARWKHLPVVVLSGRADEESVRQAYAAGADDFVRKPVLGPELRARVANQLERTRLHRRLTETDPLTGLDNRPSLMRRLERLQEFSDRFASPLSLAVLTVDRMQRVNERYGHAVGDEVLRRLATQLRVAFHGEDAVASLGGAEFVVAVLGMGREDAVRRLRGVLDAFGATEQLLERGSFTVAVSAGVAEYGPDGTAFDALYRAASGALRTAAAGGHRVLATGAGPARADDDVDIVIVEDDEVLADLLRHTLTEAGFRCVVLPDGLQAIDRLTARQGPLRTAAVLLDIDLPGRSGYEVLHALQEAGTTERTAVVVLTARSSETEAMRALRGGAVDHIAKPFSVPMLVQKMRRLVPGRP